MKKRVFLVSCLLLTLSVGGRVLADCVSSANDNNGACYTSNSSDGKKCLNPLSGDDKDCVKGQTGVIGE